MAKKKLPLVAICGRPNVGKSTLFNRLTGKSRAIVHDEAGVTRDRYYGEVQWTDAKRSRVVDTGGIVDTFETAIARKMQSQVKAALDEAVVVVFVVDAQEPPTRLDYEVRDMLFKLGKPVILAANKLDNFKMSERSNEFYELGMGEPLAISSGHGIGIEELQEAVAAHLPETPADEEGGDEQETPKITHVAIVGKPNVGKSSFVNAILNEERVIVDPTPGTTREAIDAEFHWKGKDYILIDTAGLRRKAGITDSVEHFSVTRSLRAVRRADVCLLLIDAIEGVSEQDKRIIGYAVEQGTAMVLAWTKWDLVEKPEEKFKKLSEDIDYHMPHMKYVPFVTMSNITRQRVFKVFEYVDRVAEASNKRIATAALNDALAEIVAQNPPPSSSGRNGKIRYITQASVKPTLFVLFVNQKSLFHFSYLRYIENQLREKFGFEGVPIKLELREAKRDAD